MKNTPITQKYKISLDALSNDKNKMLDNEKNMYINNTYKYKIKKNKLHLTFELSAESVEDIIRGKHSLDIITIYNLDKDDNVVLKQQMSTKYLYYNIESNQFHNTNTLEVEIVYGIKMFVPYSHINYKV